MHTRPPLFVTVLGTLSLTACAAAGPAGVTFLGEANFPAGHQFAGTTVGGLSGITYDPATETFLVISDDRSERNPARAYRVAINLDDGTLNAGDVTFLEVITLRRPDGTAYPSGGLDTEGVALAGPGTFWVSSEGTNNAQPLAPFVNLYSAATGQVAATLPIPAKFLPTPTTGVRDNLSLETLTARPESNLLFTATENALLQDGPAALTNGVTTCRVVRYDTAQQQPSGEFVYVAGPFTPPLPGGMLVSGGGGLCDFAALSPTRFLALERAVYTVGFDNRVYEATLDGAGDVAAVPALAAPPPGFTLLPMSKHLRLNIGDYVPGDNFEGLCLGPVLPDGRRVLVIVSDNNFQFLRSRFIAFAVDVSPCGGATAGDANCDGVVNFDDMDCFVAALVSAEAWHTCGAAAGCAYACANDMNADGAVNFDDIDAFVTCLVLGCP